MYRFNFYLSDDQLSYLRELSDHTRLSVADHLRRMVRPPAAEGWKKTETPRQSGFGYSEDD